jgi:phospholipase/lecithinase/hemolysin
MRDLVGVTNPIDAINARLDSFLGVMSGLIAKGVGTLLVPNLPNLGLIPEFRNTEDTSAATDVTEAWNSGLEQRLIDLSATTTSASIFYLDVFGIFGSILDGTSGTSGFNNTADECRSVTFTLPDGSISASSREVECADADSYLFWDKIHPTTAAHEFLGSKAFALLGSDNRSHAVPEPAALWLMLLGLGAFVGRRVTAAKAA